MEQELLRGFDMAKELLEVIVHISKNNNNEEELMLLPHAENLVNEVLKSFTNTLLLLNTTTINSTGTDFSSLSSMSYQKRKSTVPNWEKDSPIPIEDGYAWRKYGQKKTTNSKYLRNYYRCTYKYEQGCPAMKHVQRIQDDPPLYRTTYYGHHNCKSTLNQEIIFEHDYDYDYDYSFSGSSKFLSFNNNNPIISSKQHYYHQFSSTPVFESSTKQEPIQEVIFNHDEPIIDHQEYNQFLQSSDSYLLLCDYDDEELDFNSF